MPKYLRQIIIIKVHRYIKLYIQIVHYKNQTDNKIKWNKTIVIKNSGKFRDLNQQKRKRN